MFTSAGYRRESADTWESQETFLTTFITANVDGLMTGLRQRELGTAFSDPSFLRFIKLIGRRREKKDVPPSTAQASSSEPINNGHIM
ncbi:hypothetical protein GWI33_008471 [Rhynchophorus ferrugineus]|uniref:Uncharacterized protein n=1 Tax=Rhynchophorus ferrugineus TaxID=354439 RepID=A0A834II57_RHYFE|nr:hypothetical protein GWI33_008471 [Rhynchophorus ferrugineus]